MESKKILELRDVLVKNILPKTLEMMERTGVAYLSMNNLIQHRLDCENNAMDFSEMDMQLDMDGCICDITALSEEGLYLIWYDLKKLEYIDIDYQHKNMTSEDVVNCSEQLLSYIKELEQRENKIDDLIKEAKKINFYFEKKLLIEKYDGLQI